MSKRLRSNNPGTTANGITGTFHGVQFSGSSWSAAAVNASIARPHTCRGAAGYLTLRVVEVSRDSDHGSPHGLVSSEEGLSSLLHLDQHHGADLLRREALLLVLELNCRQTTHEDPSQMECMIATSNCLRTQHSGCAHNCLSQLACLTIGLAGQCVMKNKVRSLISVPFTRSDSNTGKISGQMRCRFPL